MPESLPYAAPMPWYRKRRRLPLLTLLVLLVGYLLALPQYRIVRQHQIRRTEIRRQFKVEVATARTALDAGQLDTAAVSLLNAEFPIRTEQKLFSQSEVDRCKEVVKPLRARLNDLSAKNRAEYEREKAEVIKELAKETEEEKRRGIITCRLYMSGNAAIYRKETLAALNARAITFLKAHNYRGALQDCRQIVGLQPDHTFDEAFWANARPKP